MYIWRLDGERGCSSGVERNLAKVEVVSSNLITRSIATLGFYFPLVNARQNPIKRPPWPRAGGFFVPVMNGAIRQIASLGHALIYRHQITRLAPLAFD